MREPNVIGWSSDRFLRRSDFKADVNPAEFEDAYSAIRYRPQWVVGSVQSFDVCSGADSAQEHGSGSDACDSDTHDENAVPHLHKKGMHNANGGKIFFVIERIEILTEFWSFLSWMRPACDDELLRHQQGHFDLGELVMRKEISGIRSSLYGRRFPTRGKNEDQRKQFAKEDSALVVKPVVSKLTDIFEKMQLDYDRETENGSNAAVQSKYNDLFASLRTR